MALSAFSRPATAVPSYFHVDSFVSERLGFAYLCVPKTLSRSMLDYLRRVDPDGYLVAARGVGREILVPPTGGDRFVTFSFVRNPYSRAVSVYYNKFVNYLGSPGQVDMFAQDRALHPDMTFTEFVEWLGSDAGTDARGDPHFLSQHNFLLTADGTMAVDYIGRVESAADDVAEIQQILGLPPEPLPHLNANREGHHEAFDTSRRWQEVLDDHTTRILTDRYKDDFALLGYEPLPYTIRPRARNNGARISRRTQPPRRVRALIKRGLANVGYEVRRAQPPSPPKPRPSRPQQAAEVA